MNDKDKLKVYERNQIKLIKALTKTIKEKKELEKTNTYLSSLCINYGTFLDSEQINAAKVMAEATMKKVMKYDPT